MFLSLFSPALRRLVAMFCLMNFAGGLVAADGDGAQRQEIKIDGFSYPIETVGDRVPAAHETAALEETLARGTNTAEGLEQFIRDFPDSPWTPSVRAQLGFGYREQGRMTPALAHWEATWSRVKRNEDAGGRRVADFTLAHYTQLLAALGRTDELGAILWEAKDRAVAASGRRLQYLLESSREAWIVMRNHPGIAFRCGTLALREVGRRLKPEDDDKLVSLLEVPSPRVGFSLATLAELGRGHGLGLVAARREAGDELVVPSVLHWSQNHYAAIVEQEGDLFRVVDPTFVWDTWLTREAINAEASGNFLVPESRLPEGWRMLTREEAGQVFGRGYISNLRDGKDEGCAKTPGSAKTPCPPCKEAKGMPVWWVSEPYANLWLADEPLEYTTSRGERIAFRLTFKQRDTTPDGPSERIPATGWNHNWFSYLRWWELKPPGGQLYQSGQFDKTLMVPGGGERTYIYSMWDYNGQSGVWTYKPSYQDETRTRLETLRGPVIIPGGLVTIQPPWILDLAQSPIPFIDGQTGFRIIHPDGAEDWYGYMLSPLVNDPVNSSIAWGRALLTHQIDRFGNTNRFYYDKLTNGSGSSAYNFFRLAQMVDYDGRTNYLRYTTNHLLSEVENPYGQKANFYYNTNDWLTNIVDMAGLSSRMTYDSNGWVTSLITPYGTNTFLITAANLDTNAVGNAGGHTVNRALQSIAADGAKEMTLYRYDCETFIDPVIPSEQLPENTPLGTLDEGSGYDGDTNQFRAVSYRNSFYWNPKQAAALSGSAWSSPLNLTSNEYRVARMKHWLRDKDALFVSSALSFEREASPDGLTEGQRTFYDYLNKPSGFRSIANTNLLPSVVARRLPNGQTQYSWERLNAAGFATNLVSTYTRSDGALLTRTNIFEYASNVTTRIYSQRTFTSTNYGNWTTNVINTPNLLERVLDWSGTIIARLGEYEWLTNTIYTTNAISGSQTNIHRVVSTTRRIVPGASTNALNEVTRFTYDGKQQLTSIKTAAGLTTTNLYNAAGFLTTTIDLEIKATNSLTYHANALPATHTDERGLTRSLTWDVLQRLTGIGYPDGTTVSNRYDKLDLLSTKDRNGNSTGFRYDPARRLTGITNANNAVTAFGYCGCGTLESITNALGQAVQLTHDSQLRLTDVAFPDASSLHYHYDLLGRITNSLDGANRKQWFNYNHHGLLTSASNAAGVVLSVKHDILDRPTNIIDAAGVNVGHAFDALDRLSTRTWADGGVETFTYTPAGLTNYINPLSRVTQYHRDVAGRLTALVDANNHGTWLTNNAAGDLVALLDGAGGLTRWNYDKFGRVTNKFDGLNREVFRHTYDPSGRVTNRWTPAGGNLGLSYDAVDNLKSITYSNTSPTTINYTYDAANRLTNMADTVGTTRFAYTAAGRLEIEDGPWSTDTVTYSYLEGQRTALSVSQPLNPAWSQSYNYDNTRRLQTLVSPAGTFAYNYSPQPSTLISLLRLGNGAVISNAFDVLAQLTNTTLSTMWRAPLSSFGYSYDKWGQRTNITRLFNSGRSSLALAYDPEGQLISAIGRETNGTIRLQEKFGYAYGGSDNLTWRTNNAQAQGFVSDAANQLTNISRSGTFTVSGSTPRPATNVTVNASNATLYADATWASWGHTVLDYQTNVFVVTAQHPLGTAQNTLNVPLPPLVNYTYDANGNLTNDQVRCFQYDAENQLTNAYVPNAWRTEFKYDGLNRRRIRKEFSWSAGAWVQTNEVRYVCDGLLVLQERDSNNIPLLTYTRGLDFSGGLQSAGGIGGLLALSDQRASATTPTNYFYHADGSGNVVALLNYKNEAVARYLYDPFGNLLAKSGPMADYNRQRFSSKEWHSPSGLLLYEFRPYDPNLQRWLNQDPIEERGGINLYQFVDNDAINLVDPSGLQGSTPRPVLPPRPVDPVVRQIEFEFMLRGYAEPRNMFSRRQMERMREEFLQNMRGPRGPTSLSAPRSAQREFNFNPTVSSALIPCPPRGFSNSRFGQSMHDRFEDILMTDTKANKPGDWLMRTRPGQTGVDATYVGPRSRYPGFDHAELKPLSPGSIGTFGNQLGNQGNNPNWPPGSVQLWLYNQRGDIYSSGFNF